MNLLITGGTGLIGVPLVEYLLGRGDEVTLLIRNLSKAQSLFQDRVNYIESLAKYMGHVDAVINLAGEPIIDKRWTKQRKHELNVSRVGVTEEIIHWLTACEQKPEVLVSGSAIGYYGNYPEDIELEESASPRTCFASELCREWEASANKATDLGVRVCTVRTGVVLDQHGGALKRMLLPFRMGLGGPIGKGQQWFSWIHLSDMVNLLVYLIDNKKISGPVNAAAPYPVQNIEFAKVFGRVLKRPAFLPVPAFMFKILLGEASELLLEGQKVVPKKIQTFGFQFQYPTLQQALGAILKPE